VDIQLRVRGVALMNLATNGKGTTNSNLNHRTSLGRVIAESHTLNLRITLAAPIYSNVKNSIPLISSTGTVKRAAAQLPKGVTAMTNKMT
jgi:hypothetical protein